MKKTTLLWKFGLILILIGSLAWMGCGGDTDEPDPGTGPGTGPGTPDTYSIEITAGNLASVREYDGDAIGKLAPATISITSSGTAATGALTITKTQINPFTGSADPFADVDFSSIESGIASGDTKTFEVKPAATANKLDPGFYQYKVVVSGANIDTKEATVSWHVLPDQGVSLTFTPSHDASYAYDIDGEIVYFPPIKYGSDDPTDPDYLTYSFTDNTDVTDSDYTLEFEVKNVGNRYTSSTTVSIAGTNFVITAADGVSGLEQQTVTLDSLEKSGGATTSRKFSITPAEKGIPRPANADRSVQAVVTVKTVFADNNHDITQTFTVQINAYNAVEKVSVGNPAVDYNVGKYAYGLLPSKLTLSELQETYASGDGAEKRIWVTNISDYAAPVVGANNQLDIWVDGKVQNKNDKFWAIDVYGANIGTADFDTPATLADNFIADATTVGAISVAPKTKLKDGVLHTAQIKVAPIYADDGVNWTSESNRDATAAATDIDLTPPTSPVSNAYNTFNTYPSGATAAGFQVTKTKINGIRVVIPAANTYSKIKTLGSPKVSYIDMLMQGQFLTYELQVSYQSANDGWLTNTGGTNDPEVNGAYVSWWSEKPGLADVAADHTHLAINWADAATGAPFRVRLSVTYEGEVTSAWYTLVLGGFIAPINPSTSVDAAKTREVLINSTGVDADWKYGDDTAGSNTAIYTPYYTAVGAPTDQWNSQFRFYGVKDVDSTATSSWIKVATGSEKNKDFDVTVPATGVFLLDSIADYVRRGNDGANLNVFISNGGTSGKIVTEIGEGYDLFMAIFYPNVWNNTTTP